jgi:cytoskeleton protein RodZ
MLLTNEESLMSETEIPMNAERPQAPQASLDAPGVQLKARREAMGWSVQQVADQLKWAPRQVIALEEGDVAALPNMAVVRGFVRAYAKIVNLDPVPLVAMIVVRTSPSADASVPPPRREGATTFAEVRFPSSTQRSLISRGWLIAIALLLALLFGAYKMGFFALLLPTDKATSTLVKPGVPAAPVQSKSVPLISVPPEPGSVALALPVAGYAARTPAGVPVAPSAASAVPAAAAPVAAASANALVLTVREDSWVELRSGAAAPLISRVIKAGSTETFEVSGPLQLVVGNAAGVAATLRGAPLMLTPSSGGATSRMTIQ